MRGERVEPCTFVALREVLIQAQRLGQPLVETVGFVLLQLLVYIDSSRVLFYIVGTVSATVHFRYPL
jgi:hypothetical protein